MADVVERVTVRMSPRWTSRCKFCDQPVSMRKRLDGSLMKFDADPDILRVYQDPRTGILLADVAAREVHQPRCPGVEHSLFDGLEEASA